LGRRVQVTEAVFDFYLAVFDGLLNQMGVACAQKAVHTFLQTFTQHNIQVTLQQENSHGIRAIERSVDRLGPVFFFFFLFFFQVIRFISPLATFSGGRPKRLRVT